ncbi:MAG: hypothetical protein U9N81_00780 [Bacillota bacterium]|nr:hypothetical protein [Bacillota bacterium]
MKKNTTPVLIAVLIVLQIISLVRIGNLQDDLRNTKNKLSDQLSHQSNQISNIYSNIDSMLDRQASIIDSYDYSFGTPDNDKLTVPVTFTITPKETKEDTAVTLFISGDSIAMEKKGTSFTGTLPAGIFDNLEAKVILADGGIQKTETLEVRGTLRDRVLPTIQVRFEGGSSDGYQKNQRKLSGIFHRTGNLSLDIKPAVNNNKIEGARLVVEVDGKIVSEKRVDQIGENWTEIDEETTLSAGQKYTMAVLATDSIGLVHKTIMDQWELDENAEPIHGDEWMWMDEVIITDKEGTVLYEPHYEEVN